MKCVARFGRSMTMRKPGTGRTALALITAVAAAQLQGTSTIRVTRRKTRRALHDRSRRSLSILSTPNLTRPQPYQAQSNQRSPCAALDDVAVELQSKMLRDHRC